MIPVRFPSIAEALDHADPVTSQLRVHRALLSQEEAELEMSVGKGRPLIRNPDRKAIEIGLKLRERLLQSRQISPSEADRI